jgi:hypothetical protein
MPRKLSSWTQAFEEYVKPMGSPPLFGRWTGIFTIAAAMERKTFVDTPKGRLFPNLYTILVGPAGAGKTVASSIAHDMMLHLEEHHIAPTSLTKAAMMDALEKAERHIVRPQDTPAVIDFNSLTIISNELGVLLPGYENEFINVLTDIYDCKRYSESRRTTKREFDIRAPQFNILAATTPSYLNNLMPEGAWDQGFISRTMLIYSGRGESVDLFEEAPLDKALYADLLSDLRQIGNVLYGRFKFTEEAVGAFRIWMKDHKEEPVPDHPKLQHYNSRRQAHLLKLCMISSASTGDDLVVKLENYVEALDWLLEAEAMMPDIFRSMVSGGASRVMDETWHFAFDWSRKKGGKKIPEPLLVAFIAERSPAHEVMRVLDIMQKNGVFRSEYVVGVGTCYEVRPRPTRH